MELLTKETGQRFDTESIYRGCPVRLLHEAWDAPKNGIVSAAEKEKITVLYLPDITTVVQYIAIPVSEVIASEWTIIWTRDFGTTYVHKPGGGDDE